MGGKCKQCQVLFSWTPNSLQTVITATKLRHLVLWRKAITNLHSVLKGRGISSHSKIHLVKATIFPVVKYRCESWTINKTEHQRVDAFELWCWKTLESPLEARRSNQSILNKINPEYSLEELMLKLKLQDFDHLMWRADSLEKTLILQKTEGEE